MVGTDGRRLSYINRQTDAQIPDFPKATVPSRFLNLINLHGGRFARASRFVEDGLRLSDLRKNHELKYDDRKQENRSGRRKSSLHMKFSFQKIVFIYNMTDLESRAQAEGFEIAASDDAGAFVCNDTYFLVGMGSRIPTVFIHVPAMPQRADHFAGTVLRFVEMALNTAV